MARPDFEDSIAGGDYEGVDSPESSTGTVKHSADDTGQNTSVGKVQEHLR
jgi:hypothetical protein